MFTHWTTSAQNVSYYINIPVVYHIMLNIWHTTPFVFSQEHAKVSFKPRLYIFSHLPKMQSERALQIEFQIIEWGWGWLLKSHQEWRSERHISEECTVQDQVQSAWSSTVSVGHQRTPLSRYRYSEQGRVDVLWFPSITLLFPLHSISNVGYFRGKQNRELHELEDSEVPRTFECQKIDMHPSHDMTSSTNKRCALSFTKRVPQRLQSMVFSKS